LTPSGVKRTLDGLTKDAIMANRRGTDGLRYQELTALQRATLDRLPSDFRRVGRVAGDPVLLAPRSGRLVLLSRDGRLVLRRHPGRPRQRQKAHPTRGERMMRRPVDRLHADRVVGDAGAVTIARGNAHVVNEPSHEQTGCAGHYDTEPRR
jgi:hypothetical protein